MVAGVHGPVLQPLGVGGDDDPLLPRPLYPRHAVLGVVTLGQGLLLVTLTDIEDIDLTVSAPRGEEVAVVTRELDTGHVIAVDAPVAAHQLPPSPRVPEEEPGVLITSNQISVLSRDSQSEIITWPTCSVPATTRAWSPGLVATQLRGL